MSRAAKNLGDRVVYLAQRLRALEKHNATLREACEQAEHWLACEAETGTSTLPTEILRVLRAALK